MRGFEGWGRHLRDGLATAARQHCALTHPSNLDHRPHRRGVVDGVTRSRGRPPEDADAEHMLGLEDAAIAQPRIEDTGKAAGEGDDGHLFTAARGDAQGPGPQLHGLIFAPGVGEELGAVADEAAGGDAVFEAHAASSLVDHLDHGALAGPILRVMAPMGISYDEAVRWLHGALAKGRRRKDTVDSRCWWSLAGLAREVSIMTVQEAYEIHSRLRQIEVEDIDFLSSAQLAKALRSPRPGLAATLNKHGALGSSKRQELLALWARMQMIVPSREGTALAFDNIYELILWVYLTMAQREPPAGETKLVFRGHRDENWQLTTTAQRELTTLEARELNERRISLFMALIASNLPLRLVHTDIEREALAQHYGFATNLLDFTTDIDVAAYFATDNLEREKRGVVYLGDAMSCISQGLSIVKLPERFRRPNIQRGLFIRAPAVDPDNLLTRMLFNHTDPAYLDSLRLSCGELMLDSEMNKLAQYAKTHASEPKPRPFRLSVITVVDDPEFPEGLHFGSRVLDYAGRSAMERRCSSSPAYWRSSSKRARPQLSST
jgi:hypothetical protein